MHDSPASTRHWRIGELAGATGLTVRTLHHYEDVGLLSASDRTEGGHRLYDEADVEQLYRIRVLRRLGLSLDDIGRSAERPRELPALLRRHLARVEAELTDLTQLRDRLRHLCALGPSVDADDVIATIEAMSTLERHVATRRRDSEAPTSSAEHSWRRHGDELRACMDGGADPASARVQAVARRTRSMIREIAQGDPRVLQALERIRSTDPPRELAGWDPALMRYLDAALAVLEKETEQP
jgi:MerR family transcriptional regulator, thiopeptide resistance regulator